MNSSSAEGRTGANEAPLLEVTGLRVTTAGGSRVLVDRFDLHVRRGEAHAIVGESGSGKSLTIRAIVGLLPPGLESTGTVTFDGSELSSMDERRLRSVRGRGIGYIFQDPFTMLNPLMKVGKQIVEGLPDRRRRSGSELRRIAAERLAEVGINDPAVAQKYPFELSGGMRQRVGIAAALAGNPKLLIADEPSTALDVTTQAEILTLLQKLRSERGMALVLITHDLRVAGEQAEHLTVLYAGQQVETGPSGAVFESPTHPYTAALLRSEPSLEHRAHRLPVIEGSVPRAHDVTGTCPFLSRCSHRQSTCDTEVRLTDVGDGRATACVRWPLDLGRRPEELPAAAGRAVDPRRVNSQRSGCLLRVVDASRTFSGRGGAVKALDEVSLTVGYGESVALVGESGSGKTTLGRAILGLEKLDAGHVEFDGLDLVERSALSAEDRRRATRGIQMIFQDPNSTLNPMRTVGRTLAEALKQGKKLGGRSPFAEAADPVAEALRAVHLPADYAHRKPRALSGGERQRVAIARALAVGPQLIVCDEPVSALDVSVQAQVLNMLNDLRDRFGVSYLFITHDLAVVRQVADRIYVMQKGRLVEDGTADDVLDRPAAPYTRKLLGSVPGAQHQPGSTPPFTDETSSALVAPTSHQLQEK